MATFPGILPGVVFEEDQRLSSGANVRPPIGMYGKEIGVTPKYARNTGPREYDFRETLARLFVQVGPQEYQRFVDSVAAADPRSEPLARVLAGTNLATGGANGGAGFVDFQLTRAQHSLKEKTEVVELLSDNYVAYFFGQGAPIFNYTGFLVNSIQDDQAMKMVRLYRDILRGTQLARRQKVARLRYDGVVVSGTYMGLDWGLDAENEVNVPFGFAFLVKSITILPNDSDGIVSLSEVFAPSDLLPFDTDGLRTRVRPVRTTMVPPASGQTSVAGKLSARTA